MLDSQNDQEEMKADEKESGKSERIDRSDMFLTSEINRSARLASNIDGDRKIMSSGIIFFKFCFSCFKIFKFASQYNATNPYKYRARKKT